MRTLPPRLTSYKKFASKRTVLNVQGGILRSVLRFPASHPQSSPLRTPHLQRKKGDRKSPSVTDKGHRQGEATPPPQLIPTSTLDSPEARTPLRRSGNQKRFFSRLSAKRHHRKRFLVYAGLISLNYYMRAGTTISDESQSVPLKTPKTLRMWTQYQGPASTYLRFRLDTLTTSSRTQNKKGSQKNNNKRKASDADAGIAKERKKRKLMESGNSWQNNIAGASSSMWNTYAGASTKLLRTAATNTKADKTTEATTEAATNLRGAPQKSSNIQDDASEEKKQKFPNPTKRIIAMWAGFLESTKKTEKTIEGTSEAAMKLRGAPLLKDRKMPDSNEAGEQTLSDPTRRFINLWAGFKASFKNSSKVS
jgi:hypothetical protein